MSDTGGLGRSPGGCHCRGRAHGVRGPTGDEASANLRGGIELTPRKCASTSDGITWTIVCRSLCLEHGQDSLSAVRRPRCDEAAISFAQRLGGRHASIFASCRVFDLGGAGLPAFVTYVAEPAAEGVPLVTVRHSQSS